MTIQTGTPLSKYKLNVLCSYAYLRKRTDEYFEVCDEYNSLVDCGGFTNYAQLLKTSAEGTKYVPSVTLEDYIDFCKQIHGKVYGYVALDKIRDAEQTKRNLMRMCESGLQPMPVFVESYSYDDLPPLLDINERICVVGAIGGSRDYLVQRYQKVFNISGNTALIHALGLGRKDFIYNVPIKTADSSTWTTGSRFGIGSYFHEQRGIVALPNIMTSRGGRIHKNSKKWFEMLGRMQKLNISVDELSNVENWRAPAHKHSIVSSTMAFTYICFMYHLNKTSDIHYFIVLPSLSKTPHMVNLLATLHSFIDFTRFDYEEYKRAFYEIDNITTPGSWVGLQKQVMRSFYAKLTDNFNRDTVQLTRFT